MEKDQLPTGGEHRNLLQRDSEGSSKLEKSAGAAAKLLNSSSGFRPLSVEEVMNMTRLRPLPMIHIDEKNFFLSDGEGTADGEDRPKEKPKANDGNKARAKGGAEKLKREAVAIKAKENQRIEADMQVKPRPPRRPKWIVDTNIEHDQNPEPHVPAQFKGITDNISKRALLNPGAAGVRLKAGNASSKQASSRRRTRKPKPKIKVKYFTENGSPRQPFIPVRTFKRPSVPVRQSDRYVSTILRPAMVASKPVAEVVSSKTAKDRKTLKNATTFRRSIVAPIRPKLAPIQPVANASVEQKVSMTKKMPLWIPGGIATHRNKAKNNSLGSLEAIPKKLEQLDGTRKPKNKEGVSSTSPSGLNKAGGDCTLREEKGKTDLNPMRYLTQEPPKRKSIFTTSSHERLPDDGLLQCPGSSQTKLVSKNKEGLPIKPEVVCAHCDRKFAVSTALELHQMEYCPKIPPRLRRRLQLNTPPPTKKPPIPIFSNVKSVKAKTSITTSKDRALNKQLRHREDEGPYNELYANQYDSIF